MTTRIAHISDLHLPARDPAQADALIRALHAAHPDVLVISGDLTRAGGREEFVAAKTLVAALPGEKLIVPGNHDIPAFNIPERLKHPFRRFERAFGPVENPVFENDDILLVGLNTAYGVRLSADWSLGHAATKKVRGVSDIIRTRRGARMALVACHHPLLANRFDPYRSRTAGGREAFDRLADAGMDILLHGHLHRIATDTLCYAGRDVCQMGANTALSDRERDGGSGFNLLDVGQGRYELHSQVWHNREYVSESGRDNSAKPIGILQAAS